MSKDEVFLAMAVQLGALGTCDRAHVGAIITFNGRAISWGYNGAPEGMPHCAENGHGYGVKEVTQGEIPIFRLVEGYVEFLTPEEVNRMPWDYNGGIEYLTNKFGCRNATHAEANAIAFAARQGISTVGGTLYVESSPCLNCARLIIAAGLQRVVYSKAYRLSEGQDLLVNAGLEVESIA